MKLYIHVFTCKHRQCFTIIKCTELQDTHALYPTGLKPMSGKKFLKLNNKYIFYYYFSANLSSYSHYVFSTLDHEDTGVITFEVSF